MLLGGPPGSCAAPSAADRYEVHVGWAGLVRGAVRSRVAAPYPYRPILSVVPAHGPCPSARAGKRPASRCREAVVRPPAGGA